MKLGIKTISHPFSVKQHSFKEIEKEIGSEVRKRDRLKGENDKSCFLLPWLTPRTPNGPTRHVQHILRLKIPHSLPMYFWFKISRRVGNFAELWGTPSSLFRESLPLCPPEKTQDLQNSVFALSKFKNGPNGASNGPNKATTEI